MGCLSMLLLIVHLCEPLSREPMFATIVSITLWCIWKARCLHVLSAEPTSVSETCSTIWTELIHTLRSQWDSIEIGTSRVAQEGRQQFLDCWGRTSLFF